MTIYDTRDFYLTGFLIASNIPLTDHSRSNGSTTFYFEHTDETDQLVQDYYAMRASVNPFDYGHALKHLKGLIHTYQHATQENNYVKQSKGTN